MFAPGAILVAAVTLSVNVAVITAAVGAFRCLPFCTFGLIGAFAARFALFAEAAMASIAATATKEIRVSRKRRCRENRSVVGVIFNPLDGELLVRSGY